MIIPVKLSFKHITLIVNLNLYDELILKFRLFEEGFNVNLPRRTGPEVGSGHFQDPTLQPESFQNLLLHRQHLVKDGFAT